MLGVHTIISPKDIHKYAGKKAFRGFASFANFVNFQKFMKSYFPALLNARIYKEG